MMERLNPDLQLFVIVIITVESFLRTFGEQINISDDISGYHSLVAPCWLYFYILLTYAPFHWSHPYFLLAVLVHPCILLVVPCTLLVVLTYFTCCTLALCWLHLLISLVAPLHCAGCPYLFRWLHPCTLLVVLTYFAGCTLYTLLVVLTNFTGCTLADLRTLSQGVDTVYKNFGSSGDICKDKDK